MLLGEKTAVIADDVTGGADTGVQFTKSGFSTLLFPNYRSFQPQSVPLTADVYAINTQTRSVNSSEAFKRNQKVAQECISYNISNIYKKIDSTMRGNPGIETKAIAEAENSKVVVICVAAPRQKRTVVDGNCLLSGEDLACSDSGKDPFSPVTTSSVVEIFGKQCGEQPGLVRLYEIRQGKEHILQETIKQVEKGFRYIVFDSETISDLTCIAETPFHKIGSTLYVGSSGLAEFLAKKMKSMQFLSKLKNSERSSIKEESFTKTNSAAEDSTKTLLRSNSGKGIFIVGSLMDISILQAQKAVASGRALELTIDSMKLYTREKEEKDRIFQLLGQYLEQDKHIVIRTVKDRQTKKDLCADKKYINQYSQGVAKVLSHILLKAFESSNLTNMFITGGETFMNIAESLFINWVELKEEILPGIPLGKFHHKLSSKEMTIVTKSGGFGNSDVLIHIMDYFEELK